MPEEQIPAIMREFVKTLSSGDVEKSLLFFTEDGVWTEPGGTYKGKEEIKRVLKTLAESMKDGKVVEGRNGIIAQGNKAFFEHVLYGTYQGKKFEWPVTCAYEFSGDKIKEVRAACDRLTLAKQTARGWLPNMLINSIINRMEKANR